MDFQFFCMLLDITEIPIRKQIYGILYHLIWIYDWYSWFIGKLDSSAFISLSDVVSINWLAMLLEYICQRDVTLWRFLLTNTTTSDMKVASYIIAWIAACHIQNRGDTSDNVWFDLQNCHCSIKLSWFRKGCVPDFIYKCFQYKVVA